MNPERWQQIKADLHHALELEGPARREYIAKVSANDAELRQELESLIEAHEGSAESFLNIPAAVIDAGANAPGFQADSQIANYRLVREIGSGGMGQVWLAEQTAPVRRLVALKLIRAGMYDATVAHRFQAERQSLAIMDHPAIAKVFDAGSTPQGQPFFVMEYVPGLPITEYCDEHRLKIRDRIELFIQACEGVQHAHQKAIIHRDLKPANILIVELDGKPVPRIIDFGLAKAAAPRITDQTLYTQFGQFIGTPGFMSPEQVDPNTQDIDTRTDVYSLGVILYVLLAGVQPFQTKRRQTPAFDEWLRQLREDEAPSLIAKLNADRETAVTTAAARSTEPKQLRSQLRGDLQWITHKALERDRERRYGTPSELAADLRRHLSHEAVEAGPAGAAYRLRKFARRHRAGIAAAGVLALTLAGGLAATTYEARVAAGQRDAALQAQLRSLTQTAAGRLRDSDVPGALGIILEVLPRRGTERYYSPEALSVFHEARAADAQILTMSGHTNTVWRAVFSPDGQHVATASWDNSARIWDAVTGRQITILNGHTRQLVGVAYSPDGRRVVTAAYDKTARIWDAATGQQLVLLSGHSRQVMSASFSRDGRHIVTTSTDKTARIWDADTGKQILQLGEQPGRLVAATYSPDGRRIVTAADDKNARIWDAATGKELLLLSGHTDRVWSASFSPDGSRVVTASEDRTARLWDAATGREILRLNGHPNRVNSAEFSPDGRRVVTASDDKTVRLWDAATGQQVKLLSGHSEPVWSASFSPDGRRLVSASTDKTVRIWDAADGEIQRLTGHSKSVLYAAFSADGRRIVTTSGDDTGRIWDAATGQPLVLLSGHSDPVNFAAFSPDGARVVTASDDQTARIWDTATGQQLVLLSGNQDRVSSVGFSPDGGRVVTAAFDRTARVWDATSGRQLTLLRGHDDRVVTAEFSYDGRHIVTASNDKTARIWDAATGRQIVLFSGHTKLVSSAEFSPDGTRVLTASWDGTARIWEAATGKQILLLSANAEPLSSAVFSLDGKRVATSSYDKTARIWDAETGQELMLVSGHTDIVSSAFFSADGNRLLTSSVDGTARVWNARAPALDVQIAWSESARFDPLRSDERFQLGLPASPEVRRWPKDQSKCDQAVAAPYDPDRRAPGVASDQIVSDIALSACAERLSNSAGAPRSLYQQARSLTAGGKFTAAKEEFEQALARGYRTAGIDLGILLSTTSAGMMDPGRAISLFEQAWQQGVPIAAFRLGHAYEYAVPANSTAAWIWYGKGADADEPNALARFAERDEASAAAQSDSAKRNAELLRAFRYYAAACERARNEDWPDEVWRIWRYRRASLARILARDGMMQQVADAFTEVRDRGGAELHR